MHLALLVAALLLTACEKAEKPRVYSVSKSATTAAAATATTPMPASPGLIAQTSGIGQPTFPKPPSNWTAQDPGAMRKGSWKINVNGATAELAVTAFPGDVGGRMANINRWRSQLGLPPGDAEMYDAIELCSVGESRGELIGIKSADGARSTLAVTVQKNGVSWFLKLTGDAQAVEATTKDLMAFLASTQLP
jgi:hypothetical protein